MVLDPATMVINAALIAVIVGGLLATSWLQDRSNAPLLFWSAGFLLIAVGLIFLIAGAATASPLRQVANFLFLTSYGLSFIAARRFNGRSAPFWILPLFPASWALPLALVPLDFEARVVGYSALVAVASALTVREHWLGDGAPLFSQRAAAVVLGVHAVFYVIRVYVGAAPFDGTGDLIAISANWVAIIGVEAMLQITAYGFLLMAMSKERSDRVNRIAARIDPLTQVANRRGFFADAARMLDRAARRGGPVALFVIDIDGFKSINDGHGHEAGDRVLTSFCRVARAQLPQGALLCRMGGDEFAVLLTGADVRDPEAIAERIRVSFAAANSETAATLSIGVASGSAVGAVLDELRNAADNALYRAKAAGRDRVEGDVLRAELALAG
jgi:diguanylate cyclase (GGDEF)-like protein